MDNSTESVHLAGFTIVHGIGSGSIIIIIMILMWSTNHNEYYHKRQKKISRLQ